MIQGHTLVRVGYDTGSTLVRVGYDTGSYTGQGGV